jgi:hypothetical protein
MIHHLRREALIITELLGGFWEAMSVANCGE